MNPLDEMTAPAFDEGRDVQVINKQIPVKIGPGSVIFEILLWVLLIIPGIIFTAMKVKAANYFRRLEQKLQHDASQIDNYMEQRVMILKNCARLVDKAVTLDNDTMTKVAALRSGASVDDSGRIAAAEGLDSVAKSINVAIESYPELKAHREIADAMQQNSYLQREITAAREVYNDTINAWNQDIFRWPTKMIVAARAGYTTRIPFATTKEIKDAARGTFF